jgi:glycosyltransferase involved in cell wall biosynthesis
LRIVFLNPSGQLGGAETSLRELLGSIRTEAPDWQLWLLLSEDGPLYDVARDLGVQVVVEPFPRALARLGDRGSNPVAKLASLLVAALPTLLYARRLARILRSLDPHVIHANGLKMHVLGAWARPKGTPLVWHIHDYVSPRPMMSRLLGWCRKACTLAITNSNSVARDLAHLLPRLRIERIYNAIDLERFSPRGAKLDLDALAGLGPAPPATVRVGLVATFARWKGHKVFLEALAQLPAGLPVQVRGYVIGGPIYQTEGSQWSLEELQQEVQRLGLTGKVGFTGFVRDTPAVVRALDIVVHASTQPEPFGMVIIEGMACAKAVIASQAGGAAELFVDGQHALAHAPGDAAGLARQIERLAGDEALRERLGRAARMHAERLFHRKRMGDAVLALYNELAREPVSGSAVGNQSVAV